MSENDTTDDKVVEKEHIKNMFSRLLVLHSKEILAAVVIGVIITVLSTIILNFIFPEVEQETSTVDFQPQMVMQEPNHREYVVRAGLANVMVSLAPIKMQIQMYFQMTGEFPTKREDINLSKFDLEEHEHIDSSFLTDGGGIGVYLPKNFGDEKFLAIQPSTSKSGAFIKWTCITNIDEKYLGIPKMRMCEFKDRI